MKALLQISILSLLLFGISEMHAQCSGGSQYGYVGWFDDGSGNSDYNNGQTCSWTMTSAMGGTVRVGFYDFNTESGYDYVRIYDGLDTNAPLLAELSGAIETSQYFSTGTSVHIVWSTDGSVTAPGFAGWWDSYVAVFDDCVGSISDGNEDYPVDMEARWFIQPEGAETIELDFYSFDMENGYDYVNVYDGYDESGTLLGSFTGNSVPDILTAYSGAMYIIMISDEIIPSSGFNATFSCSTCSGTTSMTSSSGTITDGSGSGTHGNNADCSWYVSPSGATSIIFDFTSMDLESCCDFVQIYDGPNTSSPLLISATGSDLPQSIATNSGQAFVQFTSDQSVINDGFTLDYESSFVGVDELFASYTAKAFPNPTKGLINLEISGVSAQSFALRLFDYQGRSLSLPSSQLNNLGLGNHSIDLSSFSTGLYYLQLTDENGNVNTIQVQKLN